MHPDERVAHEERLVQRGGQYRAVADPAECEPIVDTDGQAYRGLHRDGRPAAPSACVSIDLVTVSQNVHRKDAMLVEASEFPQLDHGSIAYASDLAEILREIREADMT